MDKGTEHNIMIELNMSSDQFNLVTVAYYVCIHRCSRTRTKLLTDTEDTIYRRRSTIKPCAQVYEAVGVASTCNGMLGSFLSFFHVTD
jgi:hypothetical protein